MKNIKTFEGFDVDYSSFDGTDLWNINEFDFIWSNKPFISDFKDINNEYGSPYQRIMLSNSLREYIELSKVTKKRFSEILIEDGFDVSLEDNGNYSAAISNTKQFFDLLKNLTYMI